MSESQPQRRYSVLDTMQQQLVTVAEKRIRSLSKEDLKSVMVYLEKEQLEWAQRAATEDDVLQAAKMRGRVEMCVDLAGTMYAIVEEVVKSENEEEQDV